MENTGLEVLFSNKQIYDVVLQLLSYFTRIISSFIQSSAAFFKWSAHLRFSYPTNKYYQQSSVERPPFQVKTFFKVACDQI